MAQFQQALLISQKLLDENLIRFASRADFVPPSLENRGWKHSVEVLISSIFGTKKSGPSGEKDANFRN